MFLYKIALGIKIIIKREEEKKNKIFE